MHYLPLFYDTREALALISVSARGISFKKHIINNRDFKRLRFSANLRRDYCLSLKSPAASRASILTSIQILLRNAIRILEAFRFNRLLWAGSRYRSERINRFQTTRYVPRSVIKVFRES